MPRKSNRPRRHAPQRRLSVVRRNPQGGAHQRMLDLENKVRGRGQSLTPRESHELRLLYDALRVPPLHRIDTTPERDKRMLEWEVGRHRGLNPADKLGIYTIYLNQGKHIPWGSHTLAHLTVARRVAERVGSQWIGEFKDSQDKTVGYIVPVAHFSTQDLEEVLRAHPRQRVNPGLRSFHEIGYYDGGLYRPIERLGVGQVDDSSAWLQAQSRASELGHPVVLVGRGAPVTVAPRGSRMVNPPAGQGFATAVAKGSDSKTGTSSTTYATNLSCPSAANSSRPCPFLGSGCYAEYGNTNVTRLRINAIANSKSPSPEEVAEDEALEITKKIVEPALKKGTKFLPLRLHVVGDCVSDEAARILAKAVKPILDKKVPVWTYNHAWHDVSRSAWGGISVLASCETVELAKQAMSKGFAAAMVVEKFPSPKRFELDGVKIQPCPNEAVSKNIKCAGGEGAKACRLCFDDKRLLREKTIIAFNAHSGGKKKIVQALEHIEGTKPGSSGQMVLGEGDE